MLLHSYDSSIQGTICKIYPFCAFYIADCAFMFYTENHINPGLAGSLRCRAIGCVSQGWVGLPPDFHWAWNSEKPQDSAFSQQRLRDFSTIECTAFYCMLESSLRSPEDNLPEAPPIPGIRYVLDGSLVVLSALHMILNSSLKVNDTNTLTIVILNLYITK